MGERMVEGREEESDTDEIAEKWSWFSAAAANFSRKARNSSEQGISLIFFQDRVKLNENQKETQLPQISNKMCCSWKALCKVKALQKSDKYFFRNCIHRFSNKLTF